MHPRVRAPATVARQNLRPMGSCPSIAWGQASQAGCAGGVSVVVSVGAGMDRGTAATA